MIDEKSSASSSSVQDRQRQRAARGIGTSSTEQRPTSPPRRRRPALAALAVLLIVGGAALAGLFALRIDSREPVLVLNQDVPVGTEITSDLLSTTDVASDQLLLVPADQADSVIGTYSRTGLSSGQLLDTSMLQTEAPFDTGDVRVGVPLTAGRVPAGLRSGDQVRIVRLGDGTAPATALAVGLLLDTTSSNAGGLAGEEAGGSGATLLVPAESADAIVDAAGNDLLGLALVQRGVSTENAGIQSLDAAP